MLPRREFLKTTGVAAAAQTALHAADVNFMSDGETRFRTTSEGDRTADAREAADWVSYANDPDNKERKQNGAAEPLNLKLWQLGNETSYGRSCFSRDEAIATTIEFSR